MKSRLSSEWTRFVEQPAEAAGLPRPRLVVASSPYRSVLAPLLREVAAAQARCPGRPIVVMLHELVGGHWWEAILHTRRSQRLRTQMLQYGGPGVSVLMVPWQLEAAETGQLLAEEEPRPT